jgi:hypothetical protein
MGVMLVALIGSFSIALAQEDKKGKDKGGARRDPIAAALEKMELTGEQKDKIKAIDEEYKTAAAAAREAKDREAATKARDKRKEAILAVLNDDQKAALNKALEAAAAEREKGKKGKDKAPA